jgi:polysaccharide biosynthesis protein PslE
MASREQILDIFVFVRRALQRHRRKGLMVFAIGATVALSSTVLMPRSFYSEARLFVRFGRENQVDSTARGGQMASIYESRESEINSIIEILKSRAILDRVVEQLGSERVLYDQHGETVSTGQATGAWNSPPTNVHELAVAQLTNDVLIYAPRKSNIIILSCRAGSPALAQQIVAKLVEICQEEHVRVHLTHSSNELSQKQAQQSLAAWQKATAELQEIKNRLGIVTIDGSRKKVEEQIADIDSQRLANQAELSASRARIASLEKLIARSPQTLVTPAVTEPNPTVDGMRQTLHSLQAQEKELAATMQEGHPRLAAVRQLIRDQQDILAMQPANKVHQTEALNPGRQGLEATLLEAKLQADTLAERARSLATAQEVLRGELQKLNTQAIAIDELTQRVTLAEANYKEYAQHLEPTRSNPTPGDKQISSLSVVQPATFVSTPRGPRRSYVLAFGLMASAFSGLITTLAAAWLNPLLVSGEQLAAALNLPLAGIVPRTTFTVAA